MKKELLNKLDEALQILKEEKYGDVFRLENFKLYDILFEAEEKEFNKYFGWFCDDAWNEFEDYLNENGVELVQLGRTSSNYIVSKYDSIDYYDRDSVLEHPSDEDLKLEIILNDFIKNYIDFDLIVNVKDGKVVDFDDKTINDTYLDESYCVDAITNSVIKDIKQYIDDNIKNVNKVFDYVDDFKKHQVKIFKEYVEELR